MRSFFTINTNNTSRTKTKPQEQKQILREPLKMISRLFTIFTNNTSATFNTNILLTSSSVLKEYHQKNPDKLEYHIDIEDNTNVLSKIEKIFQGEPVIINHDEYSIYYEIKKILNLIDLPSFSQLGGRDEQVYIKDLLEEILRKEAFLTFTIKTNKSEYKCNINGVILSSVIQELLLKDPSIDHFDYDYDDDNGEFGFICDYFNFIFSTPQRTNVEAIKEIAEDLKIDSILDFIDDYSDPNQKVIDLIDEQQETIDECKEIFELLYNIKTKTVIYVAEEIKKSQISKTEENVYDLAAYIIQVVKTDISLHQYLIELLIELDKDENQGKLKELLPFFINRIMALFCKKSSTTYSYSLVFPFVYKMYKNSIISKEFLYKNLNLCDLKNIFFISWFLPEIKEANPEKYKEELEPQFINDIESSKKKSTDRNKDRNTCGFSFISNDAEDLPKKSNILLIQPCNVEHLEEYKEMRDKCEDDNEITKLIRNDDVDTFQSIVSRSGDQIFDTKVNRNMFETCIFKKPISYLNYAAAYGSIKCFKYMILNDQTIDELTFSMAIIGGNSELIRIVDNKSADNQSADNKRAYNQISRPSFRSKSDQYNSIELALSQSIKRHKYKLSDWILDQNNEMFLSRNRNLNSLFLDSIKSANIYAFTKMIDNGLDFISCKDEFLKFLACVSRNGFYSYLKYLMRLMSNYINPSSIIAESIASSCNIYIFKFFETYLSEGMLCNVLISSISAKFKKLTNELIESFISKKININSYLYNLLKAAFTNYSDDYLFYIIEKAKILCQFNSYLLKSLLYLKKECKYYIKIADIIYQNSPTNDFTDIFCEAVNLGMTELIKHITNKNYLVNYLFFISPVNSKEHNKAIGSNNRYSFEPKKISFDVDMFDLIMTNVDPDSQQILLYYINDAIKDKNIPLIQYLLDKNAPLENALILASSCNDLELVEIVLKKNSEPSYINKCSLEGSALTIAAKNNNFSIVNLLLSFPGIDPNVLDEKYNTALIISAENRNEKMFDALLTFYGNDIFKQKWQLEKSIIALDNSRKNEQKLSFGFYKGNSCKANILLKILDTNCIDPNFYFRNTNLLSYAINNNYYDVVKKLLQFDVINVNVINPSTGETPIFSAIKIKRTEIFQLLAGHPKINLNHKNYNGCSVLECAVLNDTKNYVEFILKNEKFNPNESEINHAFYNSNDFEISKLFVDFKSLDVNFIPINDYDSKYINVNNKKIVMSSLMKAIENRNEQLFDLIIQHPSFKIVESQLIDSLLIAFNCDSISAISAIQKLIGLFNKIYHDINVPVFNGNSLLVEAATKKNDPNFDSKKSDIFKAFVLYYTTNWGAQNAINVLDYLYDYDLNHDKLIYDKINEKGSLVLSQIYTNLHKLIYDKINEKGSFIIVRDAILNNSYILFVSAINSTECDLSSEIKKEEPIRKEPVKKNGFNFGRNQKPEKKPETPHTTLFHLAASLGREKILNEIVTKHLIDVNIKNKDGETALMEACKNQKIESVKILFKADDLDFHYRNKSGQDAIDILRTAKGLPSKSSEIQGKDEYLSAILDLMAESQSPAKQFGNPNQSQKLNNKQDTVQRLHSPFQFDTRKKKLFTFEYGSIKFNGQSPPCNKANKVKLEFHNESFTEKPKSSLQNHVSYLQPKMKTRLRIRDEKLMNERMMPNVYVDQNQMILLQQQQQRWFQMIEMNNAMQAQINMKMMNQANISQNQSKKKKRSRK